MSLATLYRSYHLVGSFVGRGNQFIQLVKDLHCKLLTIGKQLQTFPHRIRDLNQYTSDVECECITTVPPWPSHRHDMKQLKCNDDGNFIKESRNGWDFFI